MNMTNRTRNTIALPRLGRLLAASALVLASVPAFAVEPFTADYQASYMGMSADGQMKLVSDGGDRWRYSLDVSNQLASLNQTTVFETNDGQWRPLSGSDSSKVLIKNQQKAAEYNWKTGEANWSGDIKSDRSGPVKLKKGDMDALMINLALVRDVEAGNPLNYRLVDNGRAKQLNYSVEGKESIKISGKSMQATKVVNTDGNKQTIAWIVEGMPVPARILQRKDGKDELELTVKSVR